MELEIRIIAVIAEKHPVKSCDIFEAVGGSKIAYNRAIKTLFETGWIDRDKQHYLTKLIVYVLSFSVEKKQT